MYVRVCLCVCIRISFIPEDLHIVVPSSWSSTTSIQHCRSSSYMIVIVLLFFLSIYLSLIFSSMSFLSWRVLFFRPSNQPNKKPTNQIIKTLATKAVSRSDCHTIFINRIITNSSLNLSGYLVCWKIFPSHTHTHTLVSIIIIMSNLCMWILS